MTAAGICTSPRAGSALHVLSLGAGVQSSCMALMAARGEIGPMPTAAVFADTGDEPASVYMTGFDFFQSRIHNVDERWRPGENHSGGSAVTGPRG